MALAYAPFVLSIALVAGAQVSANAGHGQSDTVVQTALKKIRESTKKLRTSGITSDADIKRIQFELDTIEAVRSGISEQGKAVVEADLHVLQDLYKQEIAKFQSDKIALQMSKQQAIMDKKYLSIEEATAVKQALESLAPEVQKIVSSSRQEMHARLLALSNDLNMVQLAIDDRNIINDALTRLSVPNLMSTPDLVKVSKDTELALGRMSSNHRSSDEDKAKAREALKLVKSAVENAQSVSQDSAPDTEEKALAELNKLPVWTDTEYTRAKKLADVLNSSDPAHKALIADFKRKEVPHKTLTSIPSTGEIGPALARQMLSIIAVSETYSPTAEQASLLYERLLQIQSKCKSCDMKFKNEVEAVKGKLKQKGATDRKSTSLSSSSGPLSTRLTDFKRSVDDYLLIKPIKEKLTQLQKDITNDPDATSKQTNQTNFNTLKSDVSSKESNYVQRANRMLAKYESQTSRLDGEEKRQVASDLSDIKAKGTLLSDSVKKKIKTLLTSVS